MRRREFLKGATASTLLCACGEHAMAQQGAFICSFKAPPPPPYGAKTTVRSFGIMPKHPDANLTWSYDAAANPILSEDGTTPLANVDKLIAHAFSLWKFAAPKLKFTKVDSGGHITFASGALVADKPGFTVYASTEPDGSKITINNTVKFGPSNSAIKDKNKAVSLSHVLTHEIGHALGLYHSTSEQAVMWATTNPTHTWERLWFDDLNAIRALYGWETQTGPVFSTETTPAICDCGDVLVMVWRGDGSNTNLFISTSKDGLSWAPQRIFRESGSIASPGLAWDGKRLWMVWRGVKEDQALYYKTSTDFFVKDNPPQQKMADRASSHGPRIAVIDGTPTMVWKGQSDDIGVYISQFVNGKWQPQRSVPGVGTTVPPAVCREVNGGVRLVWRVADGTLYTQTSLGSPTVFGPHKQVTWTTPGNSDSDAPVATGHAQTAAGAGGPALAGGGATIHAAWIGPGGDPHLFYTVLTDDSLTKTPAPKWSTQVPIPNVTSADSPALAIFKNWVVVVWRGRENKGIYATRLILEST